MNTELFSTPYLPSPGIGSNPLNTVSELNASIALQNQRYARMEDIGSQELKAIVHDQIVDEQTESFEKLLQEWATSPVEEMGRRAAQLTVELDELKTKQSEEVQRLQAVHDALARDIALALELAPSKAAPIKAVEEGHANDLNQIPFADRQRSLENELEDVNSELSQHYQAWEIPRALSAEDRAAMAQLVAEAAYEDKQSELVTEDFMPITPEERMRQASVADRAKRVVQNSEASAYITYYLTEQEGQIVTVDELARFLYVADVEERRSNVTTILGPKVQGVRIRKALADQGFELQYGWRVLKRLDEGKCREVRRTRIYRAVRPGAAVEDTFQSDASLNGVTRRIEDSFEPRTVRLPEVTAKQTDQSDGIGAEEPVLLETLAIGEASISEKEDWREAFTKEARGEIKRLVEDHLFLDDDLRGTVIRALSSSAKLGTETMKKRLNAAGLMKISDVKHDTMNREQRVVGLLVNAHPHSLGQRGKKQREALAIIRGLISERLAELKKNAEA